MNNFINLNKIICYFDVSLHFAFFFDLQLIDKISFPLIRTSLNSEDDGVLLDAVICQAYSMGRF